MNDQNIYLFTTDGVNYRAFSELETIPHDFEPLVMINPPAIAHNNPALTSEGVLKESIAETMESTCIAPCSRDTEFITSKTSSETPRTDHVCAVSYREADLERLCRELERENNALRAQSASDAHWLTVLREQIERE